MSDGDTITLNFSWSQGTNESGEWSDLHVKFFGFGPDRQIETMVIPKAMVQTIGLMHERRKPNTTITVPAAFIDPATTHDERLNMFRHALFQAADNP